MTIIRPRSSEPSPRPKPGGSVQVVPGPQGKKGDPGDPTELLAPITPGQAVTKDADGAPQGLDVLIPGDLDTTGGAASHTAVASLTTTVAGKAPLASPALTGTPTAPTPAVGDNSTKIPTTAFVKTAIDNLVNGAPGALDTLKELADQLGSDESAASALTTLVGTKAAQADLDALSGSVEKTADLGTAGHAASYDQMVVGENGDELRDIILTGGVIADGLALTNLGARSAKAWGLRDGISDELVYARLWQAIQDAAADGIALHLPPRLNHLDTWMLSQPLIGIPSGLTLCGVKGRTKIGGGYSANQSALFRWDPNATHAADITLANFVTDRTDVHTQHGILARGVDRLRLIGLRGIGQNSADGAASGWVSIGGFSTGGPTYQCQDVTVYDCWGYESDNFDIQFGDVVMGRILYSGGVGTWREIIGIEPGAGGVAQGILVHGCQAWGGTVHDSGTNTGLVVVTETSGGTVLDVTVSDTKAFGATATFERFGAGTGSSGNIAGSACQGFNVMVADGSQVRLRNCNAYKTDGASLKLGSSTAGGATANVEVSDFGAHLPNQGGSTEDGTGCAAAITLRNATNCRIKGGSITGTAHVNSVHESSGAGNNIIDGMDRGSKPVALTSSGGTRLVDRVRSAQVLTSGQNADHAKRQRSSRLQASVSVTTSAVPIASLSESEGATSLYYGEVLVHVRSSDSTVANTAVYKLLVGKHAAGSHCTEISKGGLTAGTGASWPSFTWALDTANNHLEASVVGSTSGTFAFYLTAEGDITLSPAA